MIKYCLILWLVCTPTWAQLRVVVDAENNVLKMSGDAKENLAGPAGTRLVDNVAKPDGMVVCLIDELGRCLFRLTDSNQLEFQANPRWSVNKAARRQAIHAIALRILEFYTKLNAAERWELEYGLQESLQAEIDDLHGKIATHVDMIKELKKD